MDTHAPQEPENLYRTWLGIASGETEQQKKRQAKHKRDLNGFGDPSFPLHLKTWQRRKCAIWTFSGWIWSCGHILSPGMLPWSGSPNRCVRRVRRSNPKRKPKWNPTSLMHRLRQVHHQTVTCVFLLLLITLSISFLVCWFLLAFHVAYFFSLRCQVFCLLKFTLERCATSTEPNTYILKT